MLSSGDKIGPYLIRERAGQGGMAIVFKAWHEGLHRLEALKVPRGAEQNASDSAYIQRLLAEARVAAGLHHPHIVAIHGVSEPHAPIPYFAMDWVQGRDLAQILAEKRAFSLQETTQILGKVAAALDYAHGRGVVHRDIKPANILLSEEDGTLVPKVVDFGISRAAEDEDEDGAGETKLTRSGMIVGTPEYMSPEQAGSGAKVDFRTDIYSLGVVAYEMLCGVPPFTAGSGVSRLSILISHVRDAAPLWDRFPGFPREAGEAILHALAKAPEARPTSCAAFIAQLSAATVRPGEAFPGQSAPQAAGEATPFDASGFDASRFEREEAATLFERPLSLSETPPPGPPPTLARLTLPPQKPVETAPEVPRESPTSATFSLRARLETARLEAARLDTERVEIAEIKAAPGQTSVLAAPVEEFKSVEIAAPLRAFGPVHPPDETNAGASVSAPRLAPVAGSRPVSRLAILFGLGGVLVGGTLVLALSGRGSHSSQVADAAPRSGLESAVALPLSLSRPLPAAREAGRLKAVASAPVTTPRLRTIRVVRSAPIAFEQQTRRSSQRLAGTRLVVQTGRPGARQTTLEVSYQGQREVARRAVVQRVTLQPRPQIVLLGTRAAAAPAQLERPIPNLEAPKSRARIPRPKWRIVKSLASKITARTASPRLPAVATRPPQHVVARVKVRSAIRPRMVREAPLPP